MITMVHFFMIKVAHFFVDNHIQLSLKVISRAIMSKTRYE